VVVDDGSSDEGPAIVARLATESPSIRLIRQSNAGPSAARNRGIADARGEWIAFLDADDVLMPEWLARAARMSNRHPEAGVLASAFQEVREGQHAEVAAALALRPEAAFQEIKDFHDRMCRSSFFCTSSVLVRRSDLLALGEAFSAQDKMGEDLDVWLRLAERTSICWSPAVGGLYTVGLPESLTASNFVTDPLPGFTRLRRRTESPTFKPGQRRGARRLVATHWLNAARARARTGNYRGAWHLIADPITRHRPLYCLRTAIGVAATWAFGRPMMLGRH
jgi:glycosyltransferase involved in cell wall biosynthesis